MMTHDFDPRQYVCKRCGGDAGAIASLMPMPGSDPFPCPDPRLPASAHTLWLRNRIEAMDLFSGVDAPKPRCECGVAKVGGIHSSWCPVADA
jgi:hypothetical protein